ncbi:MAG: glycosyltransferase family 8 protein [Bacteroidales bacterium]|jgi:lipopolysaccharide biosynthesis glycosyltransferase|nr:glycosyltransferase family 8 protein [Bacteroidales bacterium]
MEHRAKGKPEKIEDIIPIVFAADDNYYPYMAVSIQSILENANPDQSFKIYVLCQKLSEEYKELLQKQIASYQNFSVEHVDVSKYFEGYTVRNLRYTVNSLFRLIIPYIFTEHKYVIWIDVDTISLANVADLVANIDNDCMLKCVRDIGVLAVIRNHAKKMGLKNYQNYFSAGILVFNVNVFKNSVLFEDIMQLELERDLPFADQELLNIVCEDKVQFASMEWNVMCAKCKAYKNPKIIHYVWDKPWKSYFVSKRGGYFWKYAKQTPFYDIIVSQSKNKSLKNTISLMKYVAVSSLAKFRIRESFFDDYL